MAKARERDSFQLPITNKFCVLSNNLQANNEIETSFNVNAPEYVPIASRQVKQKGQRTGEIYVRENATNVDTERTNVKAPLTCSDVIGSNPNQKVRQCSINQPAYDVTSTQNSPAASREVNQDSFSAQVLQAPYQASNEIHSMSRQKSEMLHDNAGAASQCKSGAGYILNLKVLSHCTDSLLKTTSRGLPIKTSVSHCQRINTV